MSADTAPNALEALAHDLAEAARERAPHQGWTWQTLEAAAHALGHPPEVARAVFPQGPVATIDHIALRADQTTFQRLKNTDLSEMKIRNRIRTGVLWRLEDDLAHPEATRRAIARLLLPDAGTQGPRLLWRTADHIWRGIGDPSLDENYYSKRTLLAGIWKQVVLTAIADGKDAAQQVLDRRIDDVMRFEGFKRKLPTFDLEGMMGTLGAWRHRAHT